VKALQEAEGDLEQAAIILRKMGVASAHKKAGRGAFEGAVAMAHTDDAVALVELNSETDFVARNEVFQQLTKGVAHNALELGVGQAVSATGEVRAVDMDALNVASLALAPEPTTIGEAIGVAMSQLGENIVLRRAQCLRLRGSGVVGAYVHNAYSPGVGQTGAAVAIASDAADTAMLRTLAHQIAMHIVAAAPSALSKESIEPAKLKAELDLLTEQARDEGKPAEIIEKVVAGRMNKFYQDNALLEQPFVVDDSAGPIKKVLQAAAKKVGAPVEIIGFLRFHTGEPV